MGKRSTVTRQQLDGTVVDIEFLLIAVIQGLALTTLAVESEKVIGEGEWIYWPYMVTGFVLIINFWSLAIVHSISFITWPFDLVHTLLYLLVAFIEVAAFAEITQPGKWFVFTFAFFLVSWFLYAWDLRMIRERRSDFLDSDARTRLYEDIYRQQFAAVRFLLPPAILFHAAVVVTLWLAPGVVLGGERHLFVVGAQLVSGLIFLGVIIAGYGRRQRLITDCIEDEAAERQ